MTSTNLEEYVEQNDTIVNDDSSILAHFGILGMKWGKRNGPPYPLSADNHSANEHAMAKATGTSIGKSSGKGSAENLSDEEKAAAKQAKKDAAAEKKRISAEAKAKTKAEQHEAAKKKAIADGDAKTIKKYFSEYTTEELNDAVKRIDNLQKINQAIPKEKTTWDAIDSASKKLDKVSNAAASGIKAYNNYAKIMNALDGESRPIIGTQKNNDGGNGSKKSNASGGNSSKKDKGSNNASGNNSSKQDKGSNTSNSANQNRESRQSTNNASMSTALSTIGNNSFNDYNSSTIDLEYNSETGHYRYVA